TDWRKLKADALPKELRGQTLVVFGMGTVVKEVARRGETFGLKVIAIDTRERLIQALKDADIVVLAGNSDESGSLIIGDDQLRSMKPTAQLINVGRGMVDLAALRKALEAKTIAGAGLALLNPESLPVDHPLWRMANAAIIPQSADQSPEGTERQWRL